mgnify:CR=1 FL=1
MRLQDAALCAGARLLPAFRVVPWLVPWVMNHIADVCLGRRNGRLHESSTCLARLRAAVQPFDIILSRSEFRVSDRLIPSFFTHAAIYLGPDIAATAHGRRPGLAPLPESAAVLEAARTGVRLTSLEAASDVDVLVVLRETRPADHGVEARLARIGQALGKEYDFWFDDADDDRLFCSKLVARVFTNLPLAAPDQLGRLMLPDDVARLAMLRDPMLSALLVIDGRTMDQRCSLEHYAPLLA